MLMEREFLLGAGIDVVDFSMHDPRNIPSAYSGYFVSNQNYAEPGNGAFKLRTAMKLVHSPEAVRNFGRLIRETRPDVVHCHNVYHQLTPSIIGVAARHNVPVVLTVHDYKPICPIHTRLRHGEPCSACLDGRVSNVLKYRCREGSLARSGLLYAEAVVQRLLGSYEKVDAVIAPSEFMRAAVTHRRFEADRVHLIPNGVDTHRMRPSGQDRGYALYLGRLSPEKGIETLLAAHATVADEVTLHVAGTGPDEDNLRRKYPRARFLGHLTGASVTEAVRNAGIVVLPSDCYENCPISVLEAMSCAKAVIASRIGGIPELVTHEQTGLLFPPGNRAELARCLADLSRDHEARLRLGAAARERVERHFSVDRHNSALLGVYEGVVQRRRRAGDRKRSERRRPALGRPS